MPICHFHFVCEFIKCVKIHFCFRQQNLGPVFSYNFIFLLLVTEKHIASANNTAGLEYSALVLCDLLPGFSVHNLVAFEVPQVGGFCFLFILFQLLMSIPQSVCFIPTFLLSPSSSSCSFSPSHPLSLDPLLPHGPLITGRKKLVTKESKQSCDFLGQLSKKCSRMFKK